MEPWYTSDLSLRYQFKVHSSLQAKRASSSAKFIVQADINNVLDQDYEVIVNYPMPGRNYALTLSVEI